MIFLFKGLRKTPELLQILENDFGRLVPRDLNITDERSRVTREMRQFYLGSKHVGVESVDEMIAVIFRNSTINIEILVNFIFCSY